ncbi:hypothetical protein HJB83_03025 [Rhizobium sp. NZLR11]|nr:hypothetical protein [Rhizobium sp. NZLR11]
MLLSGFPSSASTDPDMQMGAYLIAIEGTSLEAVYQAVKAYLQRKVKRDSHEFAPSSADFGEQCRQQQSLMESAARPRIAPPPPKDEGPRVSPEKVRLLARHLQGDRTATAELKRLFPANEIIAMADTPVQHESKDAAE